MRAFVVIASLLMVSAIPALAEPTRDEVMSAAERCYGIADNHAWLDCFYGSAQPMRSLLGLVPASAAQVKLVPPPGANYGGARAAPSRTAPLPPREESEGFFSALLGNGKPLVANMPMTAYELRPTGFVVTMPDGQRWAQNEGDGSVAHWRKPASAYLVTIGYGALKSVNLRVKGEDTIYKVHKVP
jgi:hypothetical protein